MTIIRSFILIFFFTISGFIIVNDVTAQTIDKVDSIPGYFNFKFGTSKSALLNYLKADNDQESNQKKYYMVDLSLDKRYTKAFDNTIEKIQLHFDKEEKLDQITMSYVNVPKDDEAKFKAVHSSTYRFLKNQFGKHTRKLQGTDGIIYFWKGTENEVRYSITPSRLYPFYYFSVRVMKKES